MAHFGEWLFKARTEARLTQEELAARAGISKNYVSTLERNLPNYKTGAPPQPSRQRVINIALGLGVPVNEALQAAGYAETDGPKLPYGGTAIHPDGTASRVGEDGEIYSMTNEDIKAYLIRLNEKVSALTDLIIKLGVDKNTPE